MPYLKIDPDSMILRDHLAFDRTVLANERTLLAYLRTAIALIAAGATLIKIFPDDGAIILLGKLLLGIGGLTLFVGFGRFVVVSKKLAVTYKKPSS